MRVQRICSVWGDDEEWECSVYAACESQVWVCHLGGTWEDARRPCSVGVAVHVHVHVPPSSARRVD
jgi:hypothetical protein